MKQPIMAIREVRVHLECRILNRKKDMGLGVRLYLPPDRTSVRRLVQCNSRQGRRQ